MCANHHHPSHSAGLRAALRNNISNWNQPLPFHAKVSKTIRNLWIRAATGSTCCGHAGEPGC